ncbi:LysR family transcriptional regulator [Saccharibacillus sp. CPCC 101409]|uniref:LysR family transcriptional regulator n=1 Tax=Saccharibacillus sp. CPCC 101409 TaxID=3058041 RepID=UPI0026725DBD|nr:LysR family transcriptional regulator [Saccharibacillus sp. CPCC 101409]MDO3412225.1 LysR family transcriptional regulator [Saccharibacillus sp. CPCC 101409]
MNNMNLTKLRIVELLETHRKITTVAEILNLKQPTVTFHMKNMEKEFGVKLFEARMGKIILTDAGYALHHYAVKIGALAEEAQRAVLEFDTLRRGELKIGASYVPATYILPGMLHRFSGKYPGVHLSLAVKTAPVIRGMLERREIDLGIISTDSFQSPELHTEPICEDDLVLIFSPKHPLAKVEAPTAGQIAASYFVMHGTESSTRRLTERWLERSGRRLPSWLELDSLEAIKQTVMLGEHVSFVSRMAVQSEVERGLLNVYPVPEGSFKRHIYMAAHKQRYPSALLARFTEELPDWIAGDFKGD